MAYAVKECYYSVEKILYSLVGNDNEGRLWYEFHYSFSEIFTILFEIFKPFDHQWGTLFHLDYSYNISELCPVVKEKV